MRSFASRHHAAVGVTLTLALSLLGISAATAGPVVELTRQISHRDDDYKESPSGASTRLIQTQDIWVPGSPKQAYRFTNVAIAQGSEIVSARLQVYSPNQALDNPVNGTARGQAVGNAPAWTGADFEITNAAKTTASVTVANLPVWTADTHNDIADVTTIVQEIVSRGDWSSGNALTLYLLATSTDTHRRSFTYDSAPERGAKLIVSYFTCDQCSCRTLDFAPNDGVLSAIDLGWTGSGHDSAAFTTGTRLAAVVQECDASSPPCGVCQVRGPVLNVGADAGALHNRRCSNNTRTKCTTNADCGGGSCEYFVGSYLPNFALNFCIGSRVAGPLTGAFNESNGDLALAVNLTSTFYFPVDGTGKCPVCVGDGAANDGVRGGMCSAGPNSGLSCDVSGQANPHLGKTSLDCPPSTSAALLSNVIDASTFSETATLSAANPNCTAPGFTGSKCLCSTCNNAAAPPCFTSAECPANPPGTPGICGGRRCLGGTNNGKPCSLASECPSGGCNRPGQPTAPNQCDDATCTPTSGGEGECAAGPVDRFCSTATYWGCLGDADCAAFKTCSNAPATVCATAVDCPSGGSCVQDTCTNKTRECFTDNGTIGGSVTAVASKTTPVGGEWDVVLANNLTCAPPTVLGAVNSGAGLPGLSRFTLPAHVRVLP